MPKKSVREMSKLEKKHFSIESRVFHASFKSSVLLGLVAFIIGLGLYSYALAGQYVNESFQLSRNAAAALTKVADVVPMSEETMDIYHGLTKNEFFRYPSA